MTRPPERYIGWARRGRPSTLAAAKVQNGRDSMGIEPVFLFDLDGTLVDSVYQHVLAWK